MEDFVSFTIPAADGFQIAASMFGASDRVIVIHSAVAVPRYFYYRFARFFSAHGFTVVTYDYRGIGGSRPASLRAMPIQYRDWGALDAKAVMKWGHDSLKPKRFYAVCHSGGGQLLGLVPETLQLDRLALIASPSGASANYPLSGKLTLAAITLSVPIMKLLFGYMPLNCLKLGEDLPIGMVSEAMRWSRRPGFLTDPKFGLSLPGFEYSGPLLSIGIADDPIAPPRAVDALAGFYKNAKTVRRQYVPAQAGLKNIGHFGYFREHNERLWTELLEWIEGR